MIRFREYLDNFFRLTNEEWSSLSAHINTIHLKKGTTIYEFINTHGGLCFIAKGIIRSYLVNKSGRDYTLNFYCANTQDVTNRIILSSSLFSQLYKNQESSEIAFEILTDATLYCINREDLKKLCSEKSIWKDFFQFLLESYYSAAQERIIALLTKNSQERLKMLEEYFPVLFQKNISLEHIASYIGITRQSLNRVKRKD